MYGEDAVFGTENGEVLSYFPKPVDEGEPEGGGPEGHPLAPGPHEAEQAAHRVAEVDRQQEDHVHEHRVQGQPPDVEAGAIDYRKKNFFIRRKCEIFFLILRKCQMIYLVFFLIRKK